MIKQNFIHAKIYVVDGLCAVVGSVNLTEYGFYKNVEHIVMMQDPQEVQAEDVDGKARMERNK